MNVFDFDGTIYNGESAVDFIIYYLRHDLSVLKFMPMVFSALIKYKRGKISLDDFTYKYGGEITKYLKENDMDYEKLVSDFWDKKMHKIKPFYKTMQRSDDVIITASPSIVMNEICSRLGIENLISTEIDMKTGEIKQACFREAKISCFRKVYPDGVIDDFYTDSLNDKFLFPLAKRVFMVKGNKIERYK